MQPSDRRGIHNSDTWVSTLGYSCCQPDGNDVELSDAKKHDGLRAPVDGIGGPKANACKRFGHDRSWLTSACRHVKPVPLPGFKQKSVLLVGLPKPSTFGRLPGQRQSVLFAVSITAARWHSFGRLGPKLF